MLKSIISRLREPSSFAGLAALSVLVGIPPGAADAVAQILGGIAAILAIVLPERPRDA